MTQQTLKKKIRIASLKVLEEYGILMAEAIATELADEIHEVVVSRKREKITTCPREWMHDLSKICGISEYTATLAMRHQISECGQVLINSGAELDDLKNFYIWWKSDGWRAQNIPTPTPKQIRDSWGKFQNEREKLKQADPTPAKQANTNFSQRL